MPNPFQPSGSGHEVEIPERKGVPGFGDRFRAGAKLQLLLTPGFRQAGFAAVGENGPAP